MLPTLRLSLPPPPPAPLAVPAVRAVQPNMAPKRGIKKSKVKHQTFYMPYKVISHQERKGLT
jgi:hypothetical protein